MKDLLLWFLREAYASPRKGIWFALVVLTWAYRTLYVPSAIWWIDTVLAWFEQGCKVWTREVYSFSYRYINGVSFYIARLLTTTAVRPHKAWKDESESSVWRGHQTTLNAVVERKACTLNPDYLSNGEETSEHSRKRAQTSGRASGEQSSNTQRRWSHWLTRRSKQVDAGPAAQHQTAVVDARASQDGSATASAPAWWPPQRWALFRRQPDPAPAANGQRHGKRTKPRTSNRGSDGERPSMFAAERYSLFEVNAQAGLFEGALMTIEVMWTRVFKALRAVLCVVYLVPRERPSTLEGGWGHARRQSFGDLASLPADEEPPMPRISRSKSMVVSADLGRALSPVEKAVKQAGYPYSGYEVVTSDGYILQLHRLPRPGSRDASFFVHGVMDTALAWVGTSVTEALAFAAWDAGYDVWLASCRSNPPRTHTQRSHRGAKYFSYTVNELACLDLSAQIERIHHVKCNELREGDVPVRRVTPERGCMSFDGPRTSGAGMPAPLSMPAGTATGGQHSARAGARRKAKSSKRHASDGDLAGLERRSADGAQAPEAQLPVSQPAATDGKPPLSAKPRRRRRGKGMPPAASAAAAPASQPLPSAPVVPLDDASPFCTSREPPSDGANGAAADAAPELGAVASHKVSVSSSSGDDSVDAEFADAAGARPGLLERITQSQYGAEERAQLETSAAHVSEFVATRQVGYERPDELTVPLGDRASRHFHSGSTAVRASTETTAGSKPAAAQPTADPLEGVARQARSTLPRVSPEPDAATPRLQDNEDSDGRSPFVSAPQSFASSSLTGSSSTTAASADAPAASAPATVNAGTNTGGRGSPMPYVLTAVGHSLGGAELLMYTVAQLRRHEPHRLARLVLLTPAGFVAKVPMLVRPVAWVLPTLIWLFRRFTRDGLCVPFIIPTTWARTLVFGLGADVKAVPELNNLMRSLIMTMMNGDPSQWESAMRMPHYTAAEMPVASLLEAHHVLQWVHTRRFTMYDYGDVDLNREAYGQARPIDIAAEYHRIDVPVDFAAGRKDMIIEADSVRQHYEHMKAAGVERLSWREFDFGHLDFTFSAQQDLKHYVVGRLERWPPLNGQQPRAPGRPFA